MKTIKFYIKCIAIFLKDNAPMSRQKTRRLHRGFEKAKKEVGL